jgi:glutathione peroxidase
VLKKISVGPGKMQHPLYAFLTDKKKNPKTGGAIKWNFDKFLVNGLGTPVGRYGPREDPLGPKITTDVEKVLKTLPKKDKAKSNEPAKK